MKRRATREPRIESEYLESDAGEATVAPDTAAVETAVPEAADPEMAAPEVTARESGQRTPKRLEDSHKDDASDDVMDDDKKRFRFFLGFISLAFIIVSFVFGRSTSKNDIETVMKGFSAGISPGTQMVREDPQMQAKDYTVTVSDDGGGRVELSIWDFADEDGDYVQVFVDGQPRTDPFAISHRVVKVQVPSRGLIQVKGIRDGKDNGISYAVFFNRTGETYFNVAPLNGMNTYTIQTAR